MNMEFLKNNEKKEDDSDKMSWTDKEAMAQLELLVAILNGFDIKSFESKKWFLRWVGWEDGIPPPFYIIYFFPPYI